MAKTNPPPTETVSLSPTEQKIMLALAANRELGGPVMGQTEAMILPSAIEKGAALQRGLTESSNANLILPYRTLIESAALLDQQTSDLEKTAEQQLSVSRLGPSAIPKQENTLGLEPE